MGKYIDAESLKTKIENSIRCYDNYGISGPYEGGELDAYKEILALIDGLQQEQPEVDLEEAMQVEYYKYAIYESGSISGEGYQLEAQGHYECNLTRKEFKDIARHFYELGLNARREENK